MKTEWSQTFCWMMYVSINAVLMYIRVNKYVQDRWFNSLHGEFRRNMKPLHLVNWKATERQRNVIEWHWTSIRPTFQNFQLLFNWLNGMVLSCEILNTYHGMQSFTLTLSKVDLYWKQNCLLLFGHVIIYIEKFDYIRYNAWLVLL